MGRGYIDVKGEMAIQRERGNIAILMEKGDMAVLRERRKWLY